MNKTQITQTRSGVGIQLANSVQLQFALADGRLLGLRQATVDGVRLIAPGSVRLPYLETRDGWRVSGFRFRRARRQGAGAILECDVLATKPPVLHRIDMYEFNYLANPQRRESKLGRFRWHITPVTRSLGHAAVRRHEYAGFAYRYEFNLTRGFHSITDAGTWEVGGNPDGVTLFAPHADPEAGKFEATITRRLPFYTTADTFRAGAYGSNVTAVLLPKVERDALSRVPRDPADEFCQAMQAQVRGTCGSLIDFQFSKHGVLTSFYEKTDYYRTLIEWRAGDEGIGHLDQHFFPLTTRHTSPPRIVLAARRPGVTRAEALNRWTDAYDHVANLWRKQTGIPTHQPLPGLCVDSCGYAPLCAGFPPKDVLPKWEKQFAWLAQMGCKYFYLGGLGNHQGHVRPFVSNMCAPHDYSVIARYGGPERFRTFCERAHAHGIKVALWVGVHLSHRAPIWDKHPEWKTYNDSKVLHSIAYGGACQVPSLRRGFPEWLLPQFRALKQLGLDMIFWDSYPNMGSQPIDYADPVLRPALKDLCELHRRIEKLGLAVYTEGIGPLGVTSLGFAPNWYATSPALSYHTGFRAGVSDFVGCEWPKLSKFRGRPRGPITEALFFDMLANKAPLGWWVPDMDNIPFRGRPQLSEGIGELQRLYNQLAPVMQVRTIHEDGSIEWQNPDTNERVLFAPDTGRVTVPQGWRAEPVYGTTRKLPAGQHRFRGRAAFRLRPIS